MLSHSASELETTKGSDVRKVLLAELLWRRTVVSQEWLAEKLRMSSAAKVSQQLRRLDKKAALGKVPDKMKQFLEQTHPTEP
jgi:putative transposase